jgi:hypothetical protein
LTSAALSQVSYSRYGPTAGALYSVATSAALASQKSNRLRDRRVLTGDNPAVVRIDDLEREAWRRFIQRVKVLAGE